MLSDYRDVLARIYEPGAFFGRVRRLCRGIDVSSQKLELSLRGTIRELKAFAAFSYRLSRRGAAVRSAYWRTLADTLLRNPRAMRVAGSFAALYLHFGPFSQRLVERLDAAISAARSEEERVAVVPSPGGSVPLAGRVEGGRGVREVSLGRSPRERIESSRSGCAKNPPNDARGDERMVSYKELGLVNTRELFKKAVAGGYAIPAYNFNNLEQLQAIIQACVETRSPVILQVSSGARKYANKTLLRFMAQGAVAYARELGVDIPIALHLDHGDSFELCKDCIDSGFSSVMIDGSHLPFEKNAELVKKVVDYAHAHDVTVEGELGVLAGVEDDVSSEHSHYTQPDEVEEFVKRTGVDSLAISIGTSHGAAKFKPEQCTRTSEGVLVPPDLRFDILQEVERRIPGFPIVLHGSSSVPVDKVKIINQNGGKLKDAVGIPESQLRRAAASAVCKVNIDSDGRLAMTAAIRETLAKNPAEFDPRKYLGPARDALKEIYKHKNVDVLGSAGKA